MQQNSHTHMHWRQIYNNC